jgi:hypothetical protein
LIAQAVFRPYQNECTICVAIARKYTALDYPIIFRCFGCFGGGSNSSLPQNGIAQTANPTLSVDVKADRHPISPDIYGMNHYALDPTLAKELQIRLERWGANHTSRYNCS